MKKKCIFVNATAATSGGALTILNQFIESIDKNDKQYYIFTSIDLKKFESDNIKIINNISAKKWIKRLKWDFYGMKKWSKKNKIYPDLIISLQNTGVIFNKNIPQIIYLHQPIPFTPIKWSLFRKDERIYWIYKNLYDKIIKFTINNNTTIVVQSEWLKKAASKKLKFSEDKIYVFKPNLSNIDAEKVEKIDVDKNKYHIFYPAAGHKYKNHEIILNTLKKLKENNNDIYIDLLIHFTLDKESYIGKVAKEMRVQDSICFESYTSYNKTLSLYKVSDLVLFPSYVETLGLPLVEAAQFGIPILVSDLEYSREIIGQYNGATFLTYNNPQEWAEAIKFNFLNRECKFKSNFKATNEWDKFFDLVDSKL